MSSYSVSRRRARQLFGIVEALHEIVRVENDRRDANRPGERPAPDLVDAGDRPEPLPDQLGLKLEMGRHQVEAFLSSACFSARRSRQAWAFLSGTRNR